MENETNDDIVTSGRSDDGPGEDADGANTETAAAADTGESEEALDDNDLLWQIAKNTATTRTLAAALLVVMLVGLIVLGILVVNRTSSLTTTAAPTTTTSASSSDAQATPSVAGEPCVATADPLPAGAPAVDVVVGPPPTELVVKDLKEGTGATVAATDTVTVNYIVQACSSGKIIDSSYQNGTPATIALGQVIPGFASGVTGMKVGGQRLIGIPSDQAYGPTGRPPTVAPDESIWFVVEVTAITPA